MALQYLDGVKALTREEAKALFDERARECVHMGGEEFLAAWKAGKFAGREEEPHVITMIMLLPLVDE